MTPNRTQALRATARLALLLCAALALAAMAGCATTRRVDRNEALREAQYAWSAAIRWGDFEGAWTMVDPKYRDDHPLTALELERYEQVQVSGYRELGASAGPDTATRQIEIGVVNRHTQVERTTRYAEQWRYDAAADRWWITSGLPDLWRD
jgi:hypothetical protein